MSYLSRYFVMGVLLMVAAVALLACGSDGAPAVTPDVSLDQPAFLFFFTDP